MEFPELYFNITAYMAYFEYVTYTANVVYGGFSISSLIMAFGVVFALASLASYMFGFGIPFVRKMKRRHIDVRWLDKQIEFKHSLRDHFLEVQRRDEYELLRVYDEEGKFFKSYSNKEFCRQAVILGNYLRLDLRIKEGESVILIYPPGGDFVVAAMACFYAGIIAVPVCPPDPFAPQKLMKTFHSIAKDSEAKYALTDSTYYKVTSLMSLKNMWKSDCKWPSSLKWLVTDKVTTGIEDLIPSNKGDEDIAFLQYTSGSTSMPKGVMVTHRSVERNVINFVNRVDVGENERDIVSWLPHFHDMGLIGFIIPIFYTHVRLHLMHPMVILKNPYSFLRLISDYKAFICSCPNFAYGICTRKITDEQLKTLDLSTWRCAMYGAEPIRHSTIQEFYERFSETGFTEEAACPAYGLAENTLCVTLKTKGLVQVIQVDRELLEKKSILEISEEEVVGKTVGIVSCGTPLDEVYVEIIDKDTLERNEEDLIGEIWVAGTSKTLGYYKKEERNQQDFEAQYVGQTDEKRYLRTGDLGFIHKGEVFVCGRLKDMIIIRGHNIYPQDVELSVEEAHQQIRKGCVAAVPVKVEDEDALVVIAEVRDPSMNDEFPKIAEKILLGVRQDHSLPIYALVLLPPRSISKTTSGKIKRHDAKEKFLAKTLKYVYFKQYELPPPIEEEEEELKMEEEELDERMGVMKGLLQKLPMNERVQYFEDTIVKVIHGALGEGLENVVIDRDQPLMATGLDSQNAVEIRNKISKQIGLSLPTTLIFDYPNVTAIAGYIEKQLFGAIQKVEAGREYLNQFTPGVQSEEERDIAVVGIGLKLPGGAETPEEFWNNMIAGIDTGKEVPRDRWDAEVMFDENADTKGKLYAKYSHWLDGVDLFDNKHFNISDVEAESMDPQQRLLLETTAQAFRDAGLSKGDLKGSRTGVYVGICNQEYSGLSNVADKDNVYLATGNAHSVASGRISYTYGLSGPSESIDTACSSSLVAVNHAIESLHNNRADLCVAGGASLILTPLVSMAFCRAGMLSLEGRCKTFDKTAKGFTRGEGSGMVVLKRLKEAEADGDYIYGVIKGVNVNQDGASTTLTAPNGPSQQSVIRGALNMAGIEPSDVDYFETHGTGTALGDPIEIGAIHDVFSNDKKRQNSLVLGAAKTNVGHLEGAAGITGLIKSILVLQHGLAPPILGLSELNPHIQGILEESKKLSGFLDYGRVVDENVIEDSQLLFPKHLVKLPRLPVNENKLIGGVSSFGFSGTNAHVVLSSHPSTHKDAIIERTYRVQPMKWNHSKRHWVMPRPHPLLHLKRDSEDDLSERYGSTSIQALLGDNITKTRISIGEPQDVILNSKKLLFLQDHTALEARIPIFPAAGYLEIGLSACSQALNTPAEGLRLKEVSIPAAMVIPPHLDTMEYVLEIGYSDDGSGDISFAVKQPRTGKLFAKGNCEILISPTKLQLGEVARQKQDISTLLSVNDESLWNTIHGVDFYEGIRELGGISYGPSFQVLSNVFTYKRKEEENDVCIGELVIEDGGLWDKRDFNIHPAVLDSSFQVVGASLNKHKKEIIDEGVAFVPISFGEFRIFNSLPKGRNWILARLSSTSTDALESGRIVADITLMSEDLEVISTIDKLVLAKIPISVLSDVVNKELAASGSETAKEAQYEDISFNMEWELHPLSGIESKAEMDNAALIAILLSHTADKAALKERAEMLRTSISTDLGIKDILILISSEDVKEVDLDGMVSESCAEVDISCPEQVEIALKKALELKKDKAVGLVIIGTGVGEDIQVSGLSDKCIEYSAKSFVLGKELQRLLPSAKSSTSWLGTLVACEKTRPIAVGEVINGVGVCHSAMWGFFKSLAIEASHLGVTLVDLEGPVEDNLTPLLRELEAVVSARIGGSYKRLATAKEVGYRGGLRYEPSLVQAPKFEGNSAELAADKTYMITGGLGGLGLVIAKWLLMEKGAESVVLVSRSGKTKQLSKLEALNELCVESGKKLASFACDVSDAEKVAGLRSLMAESGLPPLGGVIHASGMLKDSLLSNMGREDFEAVFYPKVQGLFNVLNAFPDIDFVIPISSLVTVIGSVGQANYTTANSIVDAIPHYEGTRGKVRDIQLGLVSEVGMAVDVLSSKTDSGILSIPPKFVLKAIDEELSSDAPPSTTLRSHFDWKNFAKNFDEVPHAYSKLIGGKKKEKKELVAIPDELRYLEKMPPAMRVRTLVQMVRKEALDAMGKTEDEFDLDKNQPLMEAGLGSIGSVELRNRLSEVFGISVGMTAMFDYPTVADIARFVHESLFPEEKEDESVATETAGAPTGVADTEIAVVGMGCRFPGGVNTPEGLWKLVMMGVDCSTEIPKDRFDVDEFYDADSGGNTIYTRYGAFLDDIVNFDSKKFNMSGAEADVMDPQQRILLEVTWEALRSAGYKEEDISGKTAGVFVGVMNTDYVDLLHEKGDADNVYNGTGNAISVLAGRLSYLLGIQGPAITLDTACSSSMVTVDLGCRSLRMGVSDMAICGGVNVMVSTKSYVSECRMRMLAADGRCKTFDARADGYNRGEGCGIVVLKRLKDAVRDGDNIHAVIKASSVNQDGRSTVITAPNGLSQEKLMRFVIKEAQVDPSSVRYIECHGTGTRLGDPIEVGSINKVYVKGTVRKKPLVLGAVKANIGHTEGAAGIAALLKAILVAKHRYAPPVCNFRELNPYIENVIRNDGGAQIEIPTSAIPIESENGDGTIITAASSFGFSGTNAHCIVQSWSETVRKPTDVVPMSVKSSAYRSPVGWDHQKHWLMPQPHPLLSFKSGTVFEADLSSFTKKQPQIRSGCVKERLPLPALLEVLVAAAMKIIGDVHSGVALSEVSFAPSYATRSLEIYSGTEVIGVVDLGAKEITLADKSSEVEILRCKFAKTRRANKKLKRQQIVRNVIIGRPGEFEEIDDLYSSTKHEVDSSVGLRCIDKAWLRKDGESAIARIDIVRGSEVDAAKFGFVTNPVVLNAALSQMASKLAGSNFDSIAEVKVNKEFPREGSLFIDCVKENGGFSATFVDERMNVIMEITGASPREGYVNPLLHEIALVEKEIEIDEENLDALLVPFKDKRVLVFAEESSVQFSESMKDNTTEFLAAVDTELDMKLVTDKEADIGALLGDTEEEPYPDLVIFCWGLDVVGTGDFASMKKISGALLKIIHRMKTAAQTGKNARLWIILSNVFVGSENVLQATLWGLAKSLIFEIPSIFASVIDIDESDTFNSGEILMKEIVSCYSLPDTFEREVVIRGETRYIPRLVANSGSFKYSPVKFNADSVYVITGGTGGIGAATTDNAVERGARKVAVLSRRSELSDERKAAYAAEGADVRVFHCDVSERESFEAIISEIEGSMGGIAGVIHIAGAVDRISLIELDDNVDRYWNSLAVKVQAADIIKKALWDKEDSKLDFVLFVSSTSSLWGGAGLNGYAPSNMYLDRLTCVLSVQEGKAIARTVNFGPIVGGFIEEGEVRLLESMGVYSIRTIDVLGGFDYTSSTSACYGYIPMRHSIFKRAMELQNKWPFLDDLDVLGEDDDQGRMDVTSVARDAGRSATALFGAADLAGGAMTAEELRETILESLSNFVDVDGIEDDTILLETGLDSLGAVEVGNSIQKEIGHKIPQTLLFDVKTFGQLHASLLELVGGTKEEAAFVVSKETDVATSQDVWLDKPLSVTKFRLFVCTYAGGTNAVFSQWAEFIPAGVELCAIALPGRGKRMDEEPPKDVHDIAESVAAGLPTDKPYAMFGVCLGAIVMYEIAHEMLKKKKRLPIHLFAAACSAPHLYKEAILKVVSTEENVMEGSVLDKMKSKKLESMQDLDKETLLEVIRVSGFRGVELLDKNEQLYEVVVPRLVADLQVAASYEFAFGDDVEKWKLPCPVTSYDGKKDNTIVPGNVKQWGRHTSKEHFDVEVDGDHYFVHEKTSFLINDVCHKIGALF